MPPPPRPAFECAARSQRGAGYSVYSRLEAVEAVLVGVGWGQQGPSYSVAAGAGHGGSGQHRGLGLEEVAH